MEIKNNRTFFMILSFVFLLFCFDVCADLNINSSTSVWWTLYEQNENGIIQQGSLDKSSEVASGFNVKQSRLTFDYNDSKYPLNAKTQIRLEERIAILDCYLSWLQSKYCQLYAGQMKIPSSDEALTADDKLDFISRTNLSKNIADWSLSRPPYFSPFYGNRSDYRDIGVGIKGNIGSGNLASYFLMISNGLGANLSIGAKESKEYIVSNSFGDYFYGARIDLSPKKWLKIGGHYSLNKHDNMLYNDEKTVLDLDRQSWSSDIALILPFVQIRAMYAKGKVNDDYFHADLSNLGYSGWETKLIYNVLKNRLQLGIRFDKYSERYFGGGSQTDQDSLTFGCNFMPIPDARLQLNYIIKTTDSETKPNIDNNILFLNFQYYFNVMPF
jgi:hypothetical protein